MGFSGSGEVGLFGAPQRDSPTDWMHAPLLAWMRHCARLRVLWRAARQDRRLHPWQQGCATGIQAAHGRASPGKTMCGTNPDVPPSALKRSTSLAMP